MIISRTPYRISFFGGGTDYPTWYRQHGGAVLATTIDKYCYLTCRYLPPFFEHKFRVVYSRIETCQRAEEIQHPAVRAALSYLGIDRGLEIHHDGDLPARSGMGSSSAFTIGLLHALHALQGRMVSSRELACEGIHVEQEMLRETVGSQDQILAAHGGLNHIVFSPGGEFVVRPLTISPERRRELNAHLMLFYTGIKRTASTIADSVVANLGQRERQLGLLMELLETSVGVLTGQGDIRDFGRLLHEAWAAKRSLSNLVSNTEVDSIYREAQAAGALGGKLTGAGGGGFMLLFVPPEAQTGVRERLARLIQVPFSFAGVGSQIIFYDEEEDFGPVEKSRTHQHIGSFRELFEDGVDPKGAG